MKSISIGTTMIAALTVPLVAGAYTLRQSDGGATVRWHDGERPVRIDESLARIGGADFARDTVQEALTTWSSVDGSPFRFDFDGKAARGLGMGQRLDGISDVSTVERDWQFDPSYLAITLVAYDPASGEIWDADIVLDADLYEFGPAERDPSQFDAASVLTHEVGHLIGLGHSDHREATMFAYSQPGEVGKRSLADDDQEGLRALYLGQPIDAGAGCSVARGSPVRGGFAWIALGLVVARLCSRRGASRRAR